MKSIDNPLINAHFKMFINYQQIFLQTSKIVNDVEMCDDHMCHKFELLLLFSFQF